MYCHMYRNHLEHLINKDALSRTADQLPGGAHSWCHFLKLKWTHRNLEGGHLSLMSRKIPWGSEPLSKLWFCRSAVRTRKWHLYLAPVRCLHCSSRADFSSTRQQISDPAHLRPLGTVSNLGRDFWNDRLPGQKLFPLIQEKTKNYIKSIKW